MITSDFFTELKERINGRKYTPKEKEEAEELLQDKEITNEQKNYLQEFLSIYSLQIAYENQRKQLDEKIKEEEEKDKKEFTIYYLLKAELNKEATEQLTEEIKKKYIIYTTRDDERSECWIYEEGIFKPEARTYIKEYTRIQTREYYSPQLVNKVIAKVEADTFIEQDDFFSRQNKYVNLVPVFNGVLNIDTKELSKHDAKYCFFNKLNVSYDKVATCFNIQKFLESVLPDEESMKTLQEFYGSCLLKEYRYEKSLMVVGGGSNGKGKTLELLKYLVGVENCAEISPQSLEEDMFAMGELVNKMVNISADINNKALQNTGVFKSLTGRDLLMGARKFKTRVKFINYAKMIFSANEVPITYDLSDGFFRRWLIIDFPYRFLDQEDIDEISVEDKDKVKIKDPEIISKLVDGIELSGFLNWCLDGYDRLKEQKKFSNSQTIQKVKQMWLRKSSSIQAFILDAIEEDTTSMISKQEFKDKYVGYCRRHKIRILSEKAIHTGLTTTYSVYDSRPSGDDIRDRYWVGIRFKNSFGVEEK